jgi:hypothetical protein
LFKPSSFSSCKAAKTMLKLKPFNSQLSVVILVYLLHLNIYLEYSFIKLY